SWRNASIEKVRAGPVMFWLTTPLQTRPAAPTSWRAGEWYRASRPDRHRAGGRRASRRWRTVLRSRPSARRQRSRRSRWPWRREVCRTAGEQAREGQGQLRATFETRRLRELRRKSGVGLRARLALSACGTITAPYRAVPAGSEG